MPLQIVADENIPLVREAFRSLGTITVVPGRRITPDIARRADVLLVRSVTRVDAALLEKSAVRFVGSATIGTDHVDVAWLRQRGIAFAHAPGSNAASVVEYVLAALLHLAARRGEPLRDRTIGLVGCGAIGGRLAARLPALGLRVLQNDPPLATQAAAPHAFVDLDDVLNRADIVTLHVPLTHIGPYPTYHLIDAAALERMKPHAWLLNTARGAVVSNPALKAARTAGRPGAVVLDVWEHEPTPDPDLLHLTDLGTPHIAGYSYDGKVAGTRMLYHALITFLDRPPTWALEKALAPTPDDHPVLTAPDTSLPETVWLDRLVRQMYDVGADDRRLRGLLDRSPDTHAAFFSALRKEYPRRRSFSRYRIARRDVPDIHLHAVTYGLGVDVIEAEGVRRM